MYPVTPYSHQDLLLSEQQVVFREHWGQVFVTEITSLRTNKDVKLVNKNSIEGMLALAYQINTVCSLIIFISFADGGVHPFVWTVSIISMVLTLDLLNLRKNLKREIQQDESLIKLYQECFDATDNSHFLNDALTLSIHEIEQFIDAYNVFKQKQIQ